MFSHFLESSMSTGVIVVWEENFHNYEYHLFFLLYLSFHFIPCDQFGSAVSAMSPYQHLAETGCSLGG